MTTEIIFETHSTSEDNERGIATGWLHGHLSRLGREQARQLGERRRDDGIVVVFTSDLARAVETAEIAFSGSNIPVLHDWRLRECDYGQYNGTPAKALHEDRRRFLDEPHPGGESWSQAVKRVGQFPGDVDLRWSGRLVLVVGHLATYFALEHYLNGVPIDELVSRGFSRQEGWEYRID